MKVILALLFVVLCLSKNGKTWKQLQTWRQVKDHVCLELTFDSTICPSLASSVLPSDDFTKHNCDHINFSKENCDFEISTLENEMLDTYGNFCDDSSALIYRAGCLNEKPDVEEKLEGHCKDFGTFWFDTAMKEPKCSKITGDFHSDMNEVCECYLKFPQIQKFDCEFDFEGLDEETVIAMNPSELYRSCLTESEIGEAEDEIGSRKVRSDETNMYKIKRVLYSLMFFVFAAAVGYYVGTCVEKKTNSKYLLETEMSYGAHLNL